MAHLIHRDPDRFGPPQTIAQLEAWVIGIGATLGLQVRAMHSNHDGVIIDWLEEHARLFYGINGERIVGYDNERGKCDHRHVPGRESAYRFVSPEKLVADFLADVNKDRGGSRCSQRPCAGCDARA